MSDTLFYMLLAAGSVISIIFIVRGTRHSAKILYRIVIVELIMRFIYFFLKLIWGILRGVHLVAPTGMLREIFSYKYGFDALYAGMFTGYLLMHLWSSKMTENLNALLVKQMAQLRLLFVLSVAITYFSSGIGMLIGYKQSLLFFQSCGYAQWFMVFIMAVEIMGGIGVLFSRTRQVACLFLICDMIGATFTHFHNYFVRNTPDPMGNSLPSLSMLTFLTALLFVSRKFPQRTGPPNSLPLTAPL